MAGMDAYFLSPFPFLLGEKEAEGFLSFDGFFIVVLFCVSTGSTSEVGMIRLVEAEPFDQSDSPTSRAIRLVTASWS
jgi:hypothetical protein